MTREITATKRLPACTHTQHTGTHTHTLVLCFLQTLKDIKPPSGPLICSQLAFSLFIYNRENKAVLWLCFDLWQFLQFPTLNYWPLRERDRKLQRKAVTPHLSGGSTHFRYFHPLWSNGILWKGPYSTMGVYVSVVCHFCRSEHHLDYFTSSAHTHLAEATGTYSLEERCFHCTTSMCSLECVCVCVFCLYVRRHGERKKEKKQHWVWGAEKAVTQRNGGNLIKTENCLWPSRTLVCHHCHRFLLQRTDNCLLDVLIPH